MGLIVSSGGHVYDRTTGTWQGETQGSVGDGIDRSVSDRAGLVWHDANGPTGVQFDNPGIPTATVNHGGGGSGAGSAVVTNDVTTSSSPVQGAGGSGAGSTGVTTGGKAAGGTGAGSSMVTLGPKLKPTHTQIVVGGRPLVHNSGWSDAGEAEERFGEGELLSPTWFYQWGVSLADTASTGAAAYLASPFAGLPKEQREENARVLGDFFYNPTPALVNGKLPEQEPVDWGR